jgi:DNA-binding MarR family transcriptional regulator
MDNTLMDEIRQSRPFENAEHEAYIAMIRTAALLADGLEQTLRDSGITGAQYNVLRILRGAGPEGLCRNEIRDRMLTRMPDMTRLLDRMEAAGFVSRDRDTEDRRMVRTYVTDRGRRLLDELAEPVAEEHSRRFARLGDDRLRTLLELLAEIRNAP